MARAKSKRCPCCGQRSNLRKLTCDYCPAYVYSSRAQIRDGCHPCRCGNGQLLPICLEDRARCFPDEKIGRDAWAEFVFKHSGVIDPVYSARAKKAAQTRHWRKVWAEHPDPSKPVVRDEIPF